MDWTNMPTDPNPSLMDDSEFLAELEKLERIVPRERTGEPAFNAGLHGLDKGLAPRSAKDAEREASAKPAFDAGLHGLDKGLATGAAKDADRGHPATPAFDVGLNELDEGLGSGDVDGVPGDDDWSKPPSFTEEEMLTSPGPSVGSIALAVGGFLAMMALGAGAAVYVFRDRVALILSLAGH